MSFEETTDLADLCEYDEYDSYNEKTYQTTLSSSFTEYGIPLSVELSESLCASQTLDDKQISNCFVKAPEIFLRFDSTITSVKDCIPQATVQNNENNSSKLDNSEETITLNSKENNDVNVCDDCVELQYENEFEDPNNEVIHSYVQKSYKRNNSLDNDYEELFLEGIYISLYFVINQVT